MLRLKAAVLLVLPCPLRIQAIHRPEIQIIDNDADNDRDNDVFFLGTGIHDMTGPAAQINFMGYAKTTQMASGIHQRLWSRAFIISERPLVPEEEELQMATHVTVGGEKRAELKNKKFKRRGLWQWMTSPKQQPPAPSIISHLDPDKTICFVSIDAGMGSDILNKRVLKRINELMPQQVGNNKRLCHLENLSISGTHTHSAPAGFIQYTLYQITSAGFSEEVMTAYVEGIAQSIVRAYENLEEGQLTLGKSELFGANINRSPTSYLLNPKEERDQYKDIGDTDKTMMQLKFENLNGNATGILNWFPVHGTSMNSSNVLISGDNKGYASYSMEKNVNGQSTLPGTGPFVAAFASTNLGDVSPNTAGPRCIDTGLPCDVLTSTCGGDNGKCIAAGPGKDMIESTKIIGGMQVELAMSLLGNSSQLVEGPVGYRHSFLDMSNLTVVLDKNETARTCPAALGYSFAGGTTDGPGAFPFKQGTNTSVPFFNMVGGFLSEPSKEQKECQHPKPILLNTGRARFPYSWDPNSVPISVFRVGSFFILNVPAELTTMAGRRLRRSIRDLLMERGIEDPEITIAGLANSYTHYVTTIEEYSGQRYEAASTLYGPHTLGAYIQEFKRIVSDLLVGNTSASAKPPEDLSKKQISLIPPVTADLIGLGKKFGSVAIEPKTNYTRGKDTVVASFRSANPRNYQELGKTFLTVEYLHDDSSWETVFNDGDWCTRYYWKSTTDLPGVSFAEISWDIPPETPQGIYRICHYGSRRTLLGDFERTLLHAPDWWTFDGFGSIAIGVAFQFAKASQYFSDLVWMALDGVDRSSTKDFSGCTQGFLVQIDQAL